MCGDFILPRMAVAWVVGEEEDLQGTWPHGRGFGRKGNRGGDAERLSSFARRQRNPPSRKIRDLPAPQQPPRRQPQQSPRL